jgi:predicted RNA binding protein with dsRBD fold (UPF0201 family)
METKTVTHTPGPWTVSHDNEQASDIAYIRAGNAVFSQFDQEIAVCFPACEQVEANARLMAASPQMLQALEYAQEILNLARQYFPKSIQNRDTFQLNNACATVGKAIHIAKGTEN